MRPMDPTLRPITVMQVITPSNTVNQNFRGLYVGGAGDITVVDEVGNVIPFIGVPAGTFLPIGGRRINATGTNATLMVAGSLTQ